jgi:hypothetical protein
MKRATKIFKKLYRLNNNKIFPVAVVTLFLLSGMTAIGFSQTNGNKLEDTIETISIRTSAPIITDGEEYVTIKLEEETSLLLETGKPIIPAISRTSTFPYGTEIKQINVISDMKEYKLTQKIMPSPKPIVLSYSHPDGYTHEVVPDPSIYGFSNPYPAQPYNINTGVGLQDNERVLFVTIHCYAQYIPTQDIIHIPSQIEIEIIHEPPTEAMQTPDTYDMLIITDEKFVSHLQPLVDHKEGIGIKTIIKTTQEIYPNYNGRDDPEDIKLCIKDAIEQWGITYLLLAGGRKGQTLEWYVPECRSNNADPPRGDVGEGGYSSDLYYADIYNKNGEFDNWDSNGNGIIGEFDADIPENRDDIDFYPDVYFGRLPFRYTWEADIVVDKIITYENTADESWFKKVFCISGDTNPPARDTSGVIEEGIYEGELTCDVTANYMTGFDVEKLYTSTGTFSSYMDVVNAFNTGPGFINFEGHGSPTVWGNFHPDGQTEEDFTLGFSVYDIWKYNNGYHLPVVMVGGCHNAQFNITMQNTIRYEGEKPVESMPTDGCSWMFLEEGGGAIASIGNSGYGRGYVNEYTLQGLGGWKDPRFFHAYSIQKKNILGEAFSQALIDYINIVGGIHSDQADRKEVEQWILIGDPSLTIGGIGRTLTEAKNNENDEKTKEPQDYPKGTETGSLNEDAPIWEEGTTWTYKIGDIDFTLDEIEGRYIDVHFSTGELRLEVSEVTDTVYKTDIQTTGADIAVDINLYIDFEEDPMQISGHLTNIDIDGTIYLDRSSLGFTRIDADITGDLDLASIIELPPLLQIFINLIPNGITIHLEAEFDEPYEPLNFPLETEKIWGLPPAIVTLDGTASSPLLRLAKIANTLASLFGRAFLPPEIVFLLPVIDIGELLTILRESNEIEIPEIPEGLYRDVRPFKCLSTTQHAVEAGTFPAREISMVRGIGMVYYSPDVGNIIEMRGNFADILPILDDIYIELTDWET